MFSSNGAYVTKWGTYGSDNGQLFGPSGVAVDDSGNVYVADEGNNRVEESSYIGTYIDQFGRFGSGNVQLGSPQAVAVDGNGNIYVSDTQNNRVEVFQSSSNFVMPEYSLGALAALISTFVAFGAFVMRRKWLHSSPP